VSSPTAPRCAVRVALTHPEAFYLAFGDADAIIIADLPDEDAAAKRSVEYRPPGA
jgi:hypothetical protein